MKVDKSSITGAIILGILVIAISFLSAMILSKVQYKCESSKNFNLRNIFVNGWKEKNGYMYYYENGENILGWFKYNDNWYYFGQDGKMRTGWIKDEEDWYYLNEDGTMALNINIDGYYLNEKGILIDSPNNKK
ncbi:cell wall-binding repeat protein [Clostridium botulinum]|nr:cell wall-binding repeat protein [Clostridium botulinum]EES48874.1 cell wall binding repeat protein [Clostridium botulinum E1 str. 'BoNT E Beluga']